MSVHSGIVFFMGKKTLFLTHLCLFLRKKRVFLPKLYLFLPKKCVFFPKKRLFIRNKRKNRVKRGCFWLKNALKKRFVSSEVIAISSEEISFPSEEIGFPSEEKGISSEFGEQRKEKKYISIYISFSIYVISACARARVLCVCAYARGNVRTYVQAGKRKPAKKVPCRL